MEGASGAAARAPVLTNAMPSDVITFIKSTNSFSMFNDLGRVTMTRRDARRHQPERADRRTTRSRSTAIACVYRRSDGRNTPGVDVPYAFDGAVTFTVPPGDDVAIPFELVRIQAKFEAPLAQLTRAAARPSRSRRWPT